MGVCAIEVCRNYRGRLKTYRNVTFHRIPKDPILRSKWINIIRKSRGDNLWKPSNSTLICSDHFRAKDFKQNPKKNRTLQRDAIPYEALFLASLDKYKDDDENEIDGSLEETRKISSSVTNVLDDAKSSASDKEGNVKKIASSICMKTSECSNITDTVAGNTNSSIPQANGSKIGESRKEENESDIEDFSDLDSIFDTPEESKMRQNLRRRIQLQKKHTLIIQSLRRKNLRLKKKLAYFKQIIEKLRKAR